MRRRTGTTTATGMALAAVMVLGLAGCGLRDDRAEPLDPGSTLAATTTTGAAATTPSTTVPVAGCTTTTAQPTTHVYDQIAGVDPELLSLDVYGLPEGCGPSPVVFYVHGGAWRIGDKSTPSTRTKADWAAANGWTLVSVNYRLSTDGSGVVWPTHGEDVATAIAWTLDHADELGIDPERVAVDRPLGGCPHRLDDRGRPLAARRRRARPGGRRLPRLARHRGLRRPGADRHERRGHRRDLHRRVRHRPPRPGRRLPARRARRRRRSGGRRRRSSPGASRSGRPRPRPSPTS